MSNSFIGKMSALLLESYDKLLAALTETQQEQDEDNSQESE